MWECERRERERESIHAAFMLLLLCRLKKTLSESEFMDEPSDGEEEEQIAETEEELRKPLNIPEKPINFFFAYVFV